MPNPRTTLDTDDLQTGSNLKRIDDLESFRKEFEGKAFYTKVAESIKESKLVEDEVKKVAWQTIREKIIWIILGGLGVIFIDLILRAIPSILSSFSS